MFEGQLNDAQAEVVRKYLLKKYGLAKVCELPNNRDGYIIDECQTNREKLYESECRVTCENGYEDVPGICLLDDGDPAMVWKVRAICSETGGKFEFKGCYLIGEVTNDQAAEAIIEQNSVLHMNPESLSTLSDGDRVISWTSSDNKTGEEFKFTSTLGPVYRESVDGVPYVEFEDSGVGTQALVNSNFDGLKGLTSFTRIFIHKLNPNGKDIVFSDMQSGYSSYTSGATEYLQGQASSRFTSITLDNDLLDSMKANPTIQIIKLEDAYLKTSYENSAWEKTNSADTSYHKAYNYTTKSNEGAVIGNYWGAVTNNAYVYSGDIFDILLFDSNLSEETRQ